MRIAYYISGHGFGHISRSYEIIKRLLEIPELDMLVLNSTRVTFLKTVPEKLYIRNISTDVGVIQESAISLNVEKTLNAIKEFELSRETLTQLELEFLKEEKINLIISDSSSFPFHLASLYGIKSIFIGNFTWDFIYDNYKKQNPYFGEYSQKLKEEYKLCGLALFLPFNCPNTVFTNWKQLGIVGRSPTKTREAIRKEIGFKEDHIYYLFSFGAYGVHDSLKMENLLDNERIVISDYEGLSGEKVINISGQEYPDIVRACDYILTKPGYGILSESYLTGTPILYTDRGDFAEYPYLVEALKKYHRSAFLSQEDFLNCNFRKAAEKVQNTKIEPLKDGISEALEYIKAYF